MIRNFASCATASMIVLVASCGGGGSSEGSNEPLLSQEQQLEYLQSVAENHLTLALSLLLIPTGFSGENIWKDDSEYYCGGRIPGTGAMSCIAEQDLIRRTIIFNNCPMGSGGSELHVTGILTQEAPIAAAECDSDDSRNVWWDTEFLGTARYSDRQYETYLEVESSGKVFFSNADMRPTVNQFVATFTSNCIGRVRVQSNERLEFFNAPHGCPIDSNSFGSTMVTLRDGTRHLLWFGHPMNVDLGANGIVESEFESFCYNDFTDAECGRRATPSATLPIHLSTQTPTPTLHLPQHATPTPTPALLSQTPTHSPGEPPPDRPSEVAYAKVGILYFDTYVQVVPPAPFSANWEYRLRDPDGNVVSRCREQFLGPIISVDDPHAFLRGTQAGSCGQFVVASTPQPELLNHDKAYTYFANRRVQPKPGVWHLEIEALPSNPGTTYQGIEVRACADYAVIDSAVGLIDIPRCSAISSTQPVDQISVGGGPRIVASGALIHEVSEGYLVHERRGDSIETANRIWERLPFPAAFPADSALPASNLYVFTADRTIGYIVSLAPGDDTSQQAELDLYMYNNRGQVAGTTRRFGDRTEGYIDLAADESVFIEVRSEYLPRVADNGQAVGHVFYHLYLARRSSTIQ